MPVRWERLRTAIALAHAHSSDSELWIALSTAEASSPRPPAGGVGGPPQVDPEAARLRALVDLAKDGDAEAFGQLYDHYARGIFRFVYYRVGSRQLAEDLTSETFMRGLRSIQRFNWQGKDFGAWLTTIARNLIADHFKSSRTRLEVTADVLPESPNTASGPEQEVMALLSDESLYAAVQQLPAEQRDCVLMRFIQGLSIAETAAALGRSNGAVKQLQLRGIRRLAKLLATEQR